MIEHEKISIPREVYIGTAWVVRSNLLQHYYCFPEQRVKLKNKIKHGHNHALLVAAYDNFFPDDISIHVPHADVRDVLFGALNHDLGSAINSLKPEGDDWDIDHRLIGLGLMLYIQKEYASVMNPAIFNIIVFHHEKNDGSGPLRLKQEKIPWEAMLVQIIDKLVSGCEGREHVAKKTLRQTYNELNANRDIKFDGNVLDRMAELFDVIFIDNDADRLRRVGLGQLQFMANWNI